VRRTAWRDTQIVMARLIADMDEAALATASARFAAAKPFAHLVMDDFLSVSPSEVTEAFPGGGWPHWSRFTDAYQRGKRVCADIEAIPAPLSDLIREACSPGFLQRLETITGVEKLLPDPYLSGGGLHVSEEGGVLAPHTDFHLYERLNLYRALNLLIYLNPGWRPEDGGALELYSNADGAPDVSVTPVFGRAVVFRTDDVSIHGFTQPVALGRERRSLALYYYTARDSETFSGDTSTHWRAQRHAVYDGLIFASRALAKLARITDPNARG
jgi:hypothetical protein